MSVQPSVNSRVVNHDLHDNMLALIPLYRILYLHNYNLIKFRDLQARYAPNKLTFQVRIQILIWIDDIIAEMFQIFE